MGSKYSMEELRKYIFLKNTVGNSKHYAGSRGAAAPLACSPRQNGGAGGAVLKNK